MTRMGWDDVAIQGFTEEEALEWLSPWKGIIGGRVSPIFINMFGSWFFRRPEGQIEMLDVLKGKVSPIAGSFGDLVEKAKNRDWQREFLRTDLVMRLREFGKIPGPRQCYGLTLQRDGLGKDSFEDELDLNFFVLVDIPVWQTMCADNVQSRR